MNKFGNRLIIAFLTVIFLVLVALGLIIGLIVNDFYINEASLYSEQLLWVVIISSFTFAFLVISSLCVKIFKQMIEPIEETKTVAQQLAKGDFKARIHEWKNDEVGQLSQSINVLAQNLGQITKSHQSQQAELETLIENMGSGLLFINVRGDITLMNRSCKEMFSEKTDQWVNQLYYKVIKQKEIIKMVQDIFMTEEKCRKQVELTSHIEVRHVEVYGAPVVGDDSRLRGLVLVFHDITELKKLEQVRRDFVANVSHELKTPVTSIKGFSETLIDGAIHQKDVREQFITIILKESERLQNLIQDLLELSRIEQDYFKLEFQKTNVITIVKDAVLLLEAKAKEKNIELTHTYEGNAVIDGDPTRIKQIVINLVNNSIMYTPSEGKIHVSVHEVASDVVLTVTDTGIGISNTELPRIFERFYRVDRARSRNSGGTGLGLAIVKHLVEAHQAKIDVESELGNGTTFSISFQKQQHQDK
ncbi:two-component system histidine kinase PnpS [Desertibacillus haloalkaliphilus]|uniref:two-component system histidine kinase PnpS n=1 Tax=Desertibacillus haloalkaliphilus TaxID=1328930 RepID=UPI001C277447|nr:HAMP domain-containing sensor histidine kinase [Desertibacillus haloalkaliphilus]MBU8905151.1 PAS domain-containing protein [Desertibacillus haloalkaliphilus]